MSEDEEHNDNAVGDDGEAGDVVSEPDEANTLRLSPPRVSKTRANGFICAQLASN